MPDDTALRKPETFLGVSRSVRGRVWRLQEADAGAVSTMMRRFDLPEVVARAMSARGITPETAGDSYNFV